MRASGPAEVFPPGEFVKEELEARGWTQTELAEILGRPLRLVNEIIAGKRGVSPETAKGLADAFGTSAQFWLNLESAYQLSRVPDANNGVVRRANLYGKAPIKDMVRRNWIESSENVEVLESRVLGFFGITNLDETPVFWARAARKSTSYDTTTPAQLAWLFRARQLAQAVPAASYSEERLGQAIERLRLLLHSADEVRHVPRILSDAGIRFLVVEPLPQSRIDGACFWLDRQSPVVVVSLRYDRIDFFWHTLMHELGHVKFRDGLAQNAPLDVDLVGDTTMSADGKPEFEKEADRFAAETLIPQDTLDDFIVRVRPLYSKLRIVGFAQRMKVHAGIVIGQLQHRGEVGYSHSREMLVKVRNIITRTALTDGWGCTLPAAL